MTATRAEVTLKIYRKLVVAMAAESAQRGNSADLTLRNFHRKIDMAAADVAEVFLAGASGLTPVLIQNGNGKKVYL